MCGILGAITGKGLKFKSGLESIHHRGPDFSDTYNWGNLTFGHTRLSIIDLEAESNQPFSIGKDIIIFNGEIYNYLELKEILVAEGHKFRTKGDTEVLLLWLINKGIEAINKVEGMFTFSWFNEESLELILCRDSLGIKPLYIYQDDENLIFASEIKSIFASYPESKNIDKNLIAEYLLNGFIYEPDTGFVNIRKIQPGTFEKYDLDRNLLFKKKYWGLSNISPNKKIIDADGIDKEIKNSIQQHLVADVPVGLFYSGGIDSSIILSETKSSILPVTVKSSEKEYKEAGMTSDYRYALEIGDELGVDIETIELLKKDSTNEEFLKLVEEVAIGNEELMADFTFQSSKLLSNKVREKGFIVMLSGMGADEIFAGYPRYRLVKFDYIFKLIKPILPLFKNIKSIAKKIDRFKNYFASGDFGMSYTSLIGYYSKSEVSSLLNNNQGIEDYTKKINNILAPVQNLSKLRKAMYLDFYGFLAHNFTVSDKSSMLASIELRVPLATKRLYEITWGLKENDLVSFFNLKKPLRNFLLKLLPKSLIDRKKAGFNPPLDTYIRNLGKDEILKVFQNNNLFSVLNQTEVEKIVENHYSGYNNNTYKLYQLLHLTFWLKNYS